MMSKDHNQKTEQELREEQKFLQGFTDIKSLRSEMASTKADMGAIFKRLKDIGWTKVDIDFAFSLEDKDVGQVIADFERKIRIAKMFGHQLGRQLELLDKDRTPQQDRAYEDGLAAGKLRRANNNPYHAGSKEADAWQRGFNEGHEFINRDMDGAVNGTSQDEGEQAPD
ncbi:hypothetical protein [Rhizobium sp. SSA_523]|uniref:ribosome modulation factor n=1 Tax=Rhizobium sp. SSA_523 TaxID=2952477 RepID=UPI002090A8F1|nr:hypothetical protein [Rhizobium sp. SSA_523]MCO5730134.1 hypothetical protein [Rhizobium sp. SSA_523]WKC25198.1 hypothetical protein QTJ18_14525 [Rhizobium sp. SSA_523]